MQKPDIILTFLNAVTPRVGPANAMNLLKDAHANAYRELLIKSLGEAVVDETIERHLTETAQNIQKMPVPSPIQRVS